MSDSGLAEAPVNRLDGIRQLIAAAVVEEQTTGGLRRHLAVTVGAVGIPNPAYVEDLAQLLQRHIEWVPTALEALFGVVDNPEVGRTVRSLIKVGQDFFLGAGPVVQPGLIGLLDSSYVVVQLLLIAVPDSVDASLVQAQATVRSLLGPQLAGFLDQQAATALQLDLSMVGPESPQGPAPAAMPSQNGVAPVEGTLQPPPAPQARQERSGAERPGDLDVTFGGGGRVTALVGRACSGLLQPDGAVVVAGLTSPGGTATGDFVVARFLEDGSPDPSFGNAGTAVVQFGSSIGVEAHSVIRQEDGKLYVFGTVPGAFGLARLNADGLARPILWDSGKGRDAVCRKGSSQRICCGTPA